MTQKLVQIVNRVNASAIRKEKNERGDTVYVVPSFTLPDDVVMNGGLYPAAEIAQAYLTLEGTPAPIGHPYDGQGNYVSANSEDGLNYFYAGVVNKSVRRIADDRFGHRVAIEKHVNEAVARQTERGRALLEAIENGTPIHTSTGLLLEPVTSAGTNSRGEAYEWIATGMLFDHDAILLDEEGAATPADGVGMLVNRQLLTQVTHKGQRMAVNTVAAPVQAGNESMRDLEDRVRGAIHDVITEADWKWLADWGEGYAVIEADGETYQVGWTEGEDGTIEIVGDPEPVRRVTTWEVVSNAAKRLFNRDEPVTQPQEGDDMIKIVENALKAAKVDTTNMSHDDMLKAYQGLAAPQQPAGNSEQPQGLTAEQVQEIATNAAKEAIKANAAEAEKAERTALAEKLKANKVELSEEDQGSMTINALRTFVERSAPVGSAYSVTGYSVNQGETGASVEDLPE